MIHFQNNYVAIELINDSTAILLTWKGFVPSAVYREGMSKALEIARKHKIVNWVSDIRLLKVLGIPDQEWAGVKWVTDATSAGCYKKQAIIMAEDVFGKLTAQNIMEYIKDPEIKLSCFPALEDAKNWLSGGENKFVA